MRPAARIAATIEILEAIAAGAPAERALTGWLRGHRFAGSKDRAAIRDHVFDALRRRRSYAAWGGGESGRAVMIGAMRAAGQDPREIFTGEGHAPPPLTPAEGQGAPAAPGSAAALDCPDALLPLFRAALGPDCDAVLMRLRDRAPVHLRVNLRKTDRQGAQARLAAEGIRARLHPLSPTALAITEGGRILKASQSFEEGWVELQDAASQAVADMVPVRTGMRVLDYCAGGGGKTLALAARADAQFFAHDVAPARMNTLAPRAARAGIAVGILTPSELARHAPYDIVVIDAPCSGSGAWRRDPHGKWRLSGARLDSLCRIQTEILAEAQGLVAPDGVMVYATCSLFQAENRDRIDAFLRAASGWHLVRDRQFTPLEGGDGFYAAILARST